SAQRTASVMFDLPEPLGPTITLTPGENSSLVRAGNDLNPFISIDLRYISSSFAKAGVSVGRVRRSVSQALQRLLGRLLLGGLLAASGADTHALTAHPGLHLEGPPVRGAGFADHRVGYARAAPREQLLQRRLRIHRSFDGALDLRREGLRDRRGDTG